MRKGFLLKRTGSRLLICAASLLLFAGQLQAQDAAVHAINTAANMIRNYYEPFQKLIWFVAACLGLVGGIRIYNKFQGGEQDASKNATGFIGGAVALIVIDIFLRNVFGVA